MIRSRGVTVVIVVAAIFCLYANHSSAQGSFGIELHNTLMPASGGMGGVSIARPQDLTSAMNANPATMTQFRGTQVTFGGGWAATDLQHFPHRHCGAAQPRYVCREERGRRVCSC